MCLYRLVSELIKNSWKWQNCTENYFQYSFTVLIIIFSTVLAFSRVFAIWKGIFITLCVSINLQTSNCNGVLQYTKYGCQKCRIDMIPWDWYHLKILRLLKQRTMQVLMTWSLHWKEQSTAFPSCHTTDYLIVCVSISSFHRGFTSFTKTLCNAI